MRLRAKSQEEPGRDATKARNLVSFSIFTHPIKDGPGQEKENRNKRAEVSRKPTKLKARFCKTFNSLHGRVVQFY